MHNRHLFSFWSSLPTFQHYNDVRMGTMASQITSITIVYSTVYSSADQRKHQSSASLAFVWGIHRGPVNSPHKWPVTRKMFPFDDVIMNFQGHIRKWDSWRFMKLPWHMINVVMAIWRQLGNVLWYSILIAIRYQWILTLKSKSWVDSDVKCIWPLIGI